MKERSKAMSRPGLKWVPFFNRTKKHIFRIECGSKVGTGWCFKVGPQKDRLFVATAMHVLRDYSGDDGAGVTLWREDEQDAFGYERMRAYQSRPLDMAVLEFKTDAPVEALEIRRKVGHEDDPRLQIPQIGVEAAWLGYPETAFEIFETPCLAMCVGVISAHGRIDGQTVCLIDGVVNRGMSGGPVVDAQGMALGMIRGWHAPSLAKVQKDGRGMQIDKHPWPGFGVLIPAFNLFRGLENFDEQ